MNFTCPCCSTPLVEKSTESSKELSCDSCQTKYPIIQGIPRFVASDLYTTNFSFEWKIHQKTQIDNDQRRYSTENFYLRFGSSPETFQGKRVLDVGIGTGRYADVALRAGAEVWGIDLSYAVEVAQRNLSHFPNLHLAQADVFHLPFPPESFDIIYSFGVLHHTPDPRKAFDGLIKLLKPNGLICITVYPDYGMYHTSQYLRKLTTRLPNTVLYTLTTCITLAFYYPYRYLGFRHGFLGRAMPISMSDSLKEAILDTYDCYSPKYQFTYGVHQVFEWFKENHLKDIEARPQPVTILGYK